MSEVPEGIRFDGFERKPPRPTATMTITRDGLHGVEVLLGKRAPTMLAFPEYWAFCGGGVSRHDRELSEEIDIDANQLCILREMGEELGLCLTKDGLITLPIEQRSLILSQKDGFHQLIQNGDLVLDTSRLQIFSHRTTPPFGPVQFDNAFMHIHLGLEESKDLVLDLEPQTEFTDVRWATPTDYLDLWRQYSMKIAPPVVTILMEIERTLARFDGDMVKASEDIVARLPGRKSILFAHGVEVVPIKTATLPPADHTNCYLVGDPEGEFIIVDPAIRMREDLEALAAAVERHQGTPIAVAYTHTHSDHLGDEGLLKEAFDLPVWASEECSREIRIDRILHDNEILHLGLQQWTVLHTPGHHPGHLCFISEAGLVAGDMVAGVGTILIPPYSGEMWTYLEQLERLKSYNPHLIFPSHGPVIAQPEKIFTRYIEHRTLRHKRVLEAIHQGHTSIDSITEFAYNDTPDAHPGLARDQTLSHLLSLEREGKITQRSQRWLLGHH
jgi:ribonuclease/clavin/mitogillin